MRKITEEMGLQKEWMERAQKISTSDELRAFVDELRGDYTHDYGTICHAIAAAAIAGAYAVERGPQGGITGFQAGAIMWEMIKGWGVWNDGPLQIIQWGHLLYPQYDEGMPRSISPDTLLAVQEKAKKRLMDPGLAASPKVRERLALLAGGSWPSWLNVRDN